MIKQTRFNLGIEKLFFSSLRMLFMIRLPIMLFQSRNRETFLFKGAAISPDDLSGFLFQSRNRETFFFKHGIEFAHTRRGAQRFNLGIEKLFFSSNG